MIENIKRLVNEHHTLIVVIVAVLVICFLYWWFCCKDRNMISEQVKIRGGYPKRDKKEYVKTDSGEILAFDSLGFEFTDNNHPFYTLNSAGEKFILGPGNSFLEEYIDYISKDFLNIVDPDDSDGSKKVKRNLVTVFKEPMSFFSLTNGNTTNTGLSTLRTNNEEREKIIDSVNEFHFENILRENLYKKIGDEYKLILESYKKLVKFIKGHIMGYVDEVTFLGQPAFVADNQDHKGDGHLLGNTRFSPNIHFTPGSNVYKNCEDKIREWYSSTYKGFFNKFYYNFVTFNESVVTSSIIKFYDNRLDIGNQIIDSEDHLLKDNYVQYLKNATFNKNWWVKHYSKWEKICQDDLRSQDDLKSQVEGMFNECQQNLSESYKKYYVDSLNGNPNNELLMKLRRDFINFYYTNKINWENEVEKVEKYKEYRNNLVEYSNAKTNLMVKGKFKTVLDINKKTSTSTKNEGENKKGDFADIYPALKLFMMVYLLYLFRENYIKSEMKKTGEDRETLERQYFEMMGSYVIYVHLFNTFCCVKMEPTWNKKIGNLYVYNFKPKTDFNMEEIDEEAYDDSAIKYLLQAANKHSPIKILKQIISDFNKNTIFGCTQYRNGVIDYYQEIICWVENITKGVWEKENFVNKRIDIILDLLFNIINNPEEGVMRGTTSLEIRNCTKNTELVNQFKEIQDNLTKYLFKEGDVEEMYQNVIKMVDNIVYKEKELEFILFLALLNDVSHSGANIKDLYMKVQKILLNYEEKLKKMRTPTLISLFEPNKMVLLFFLKERIVGIDDILDFPSVKVPKQTLLFFYPEIKKTSRLYCMGKQILENSVGLYGLTNTGLKMINNYEKILDNICGEIEKNELEEFERKRKLGMNDTYICNLIQNDAIGEFINYVNKNNVRLDMDIEESLFESNRVLIDNSPISLIQYAAFCGASQILNYLKGNKAGVPRDFLKFIPYSKNVKLFMETIEGVKINDSTAYDIYVSIIESHSIEMLSILDNKLEVGVKGKKRMEINKGKFKKETSLFRVSLYCHNFIHFDDFTPDNKIETLLMFIILAEYYYCPFIPNIIESMFITFGKTIYFNKLIEVLSHNELILDQNNLDIVGLVTANSFYAKEVEKALRNNVIPDNEVSRVIKKINEKMKEEVDEETKKRIQVELYGILCAYAKKKLYCMVKLLEEPHQNISSSLKYLEKLISETMKPHLLAEIVGEFSQRLFGEEKFSIFNNNLTEIKDLFDTFVDEEFMNQKENPESEDDLRKRVLEDMGWAEDSNKEEVEPVCETSSNIIPPSIFQQCSGPPFNSSMGVTTASIPLTSYANTSMFGAPNPTIISTITPPDVPLFEQPPQTQTSIFEPPGASSIPPPINTQPPVDKVTDEEFINMVIKEAKLTYPIDREVILNSFRSLSASEKSEMKLEFEKKEDVRERIFAARDICMNLTPIALSSNVFPQHLHLL